MTTTSAPATTSARSAPRRRSVSVDRRPPRRSGANRAPRPPSSARTLVGATTGTARRPGRAARAWQISASVCSVLPSPMSSARMPPSPCSPEERQPAEPVALVGPQLARAASPAARRRRARRAPAGPATCSRHARAWRSTTPSAASSSHSPAWNRLIRSGPPVAVLQRRAPPRSACAAPAAPACRSEKYAPSGSSRCDSPAASASEHVRERHRRGPRRVTVTPRSNQSRLAGRPRWSTRRSAASRPPRGSRRRRPLTSTTTSGASASSGSTSVVNRIVSRPVSRASGSERLSRPVAAQPATAPAGRRARPARLAPRRGPGRRRRRPMPAGAASSHRRPRRPTPSSASAS